MDRCAIIDAENRIFIIFNITEHLKIIILKIENDL